MSTILPIASEFALSPDLFYVADVLSLMSTAVHDVALNYSIATDRKLTA